MTYTTDALDTGGRAGPQEEFIDGGGVKRFGNLGRALTRHKIFLSPGMLPAARAEVRRFDVIHMHEYRTIQNLIVRRYARKYDVPYVLQAHGSVPRISAKQGLKRLFDVAWGYRLLRDAAKVIALTDTEAEQYAAMGVGEAKISVLPNGIDLDEFANLPARGSFRDKYAIPPGSKVVLYLGRLHPTKGLELLARAFAGLTAELRDARLVVVGPDDGYLAELQALLRELGIYDRVLFTGPVYGQDRLGAYVDADVFVTPSFWGFPVTFVEAMACGTPVVTTTCGAALGWVDHQAGFVTGCDAAELRGAIARILTEPDLARELGANGKKLVRERYNWGKLAETLEQIYASAVAAG